MIQARVSYFCILLSALSLSCWWVAGVVAVLYWLVSRYEMAWPWYVKVTFFTPVGISASIILLLLSAAWHMQAERRRHV